MTSEPILNQYYLFRAKPILNKSWTITERWLNQSYWFVQPPFGYGSYRLVRPPFSYGSHHILVQQNRSWIKNVCRECCEWPESFGDSEALILEALNLSNFTHHIPENSALSLLYSVRTKSYERQGMIMPCLPLNYIVFGNWHGYSNQIRPVSIPIFLDLYASVWKQNMS